jgi:hypothetical protein
MATDVRQTVEKSLLKAAEVIEEKLDAEIDLLDNTDADDLERLREKRLRQLKKQTEQKRELLAHGHGQYIEVTDEKEFFAQCKNTARVVCHFSRDSTFRCKIVDKHLAVLARKHVEAKFVKVDAEKSPFLCERLNVHVLPTIVVFKNGKNEDKIVGFDELGGEDDFATETLEWRLGKTGVIEYTGDEPDVFKTRQKKTILLGKRSVRGRSDSDESDDD